MKLRIFIYRTVACCLTLVNVRPTHVLDGGAHVEFLGEGFYDLDDSVAGIDFFAQAEQAELFELVYVAGG